mmetsp:Transcript_43171/g.107398  ORF Transcript_43171/g.107398 Transcript_43171/m.107398 type:complete len:106 (-) Transcript_43171:180-497(-)
MDEWMSADLKAECAEILKKSMLDSDTDECESHEEDWEKGFNERARWLHSEVCVIQEIDKTMYQGVVIATNLHGTRVTIMMHKPMAGKTIHRMSTKDLLCFTRRCK